MKGRKKRIELKEHRISKNNGMTLIHYGFLSLHENTETTDISLIGSKRTARKKVNESKLFTNISFGLYSKRFPDLQHMLQFPNLQAQVKNQNVFVIQPLLRERELQEKENYINTNFIIVPFYKHY